MKQKKCHCGRDKSFSECCYRIHSNVSMASTAEDLMRSRYSAFVEADGKFLLKSWHSKSLKKQNIDDIEQWAKSVKWLKLEIIATEKGQPQDNSGIVEFKAFYIDGSEIEVIHEISIFKKYNNHWVYVKAKI